MKIGPPVLHSSPLYPAPEVVLFTMLFNCPNTPKLPVFTGTSTSPCNTCSMYPADSAFHTASLSVQSFCTAHGKSPYTLQCVLKCD